MWRLQRGTDPECRFFQAMAHQGHYGAGGGTKQGIYVCTASGKHLASVNSLRSDDVLRTVESGWAKWQETPPEERRLADPKSIEAHHRWESSFPEEGLVLRSVQRDLTETGEPHRGRGTRFNFDHAWFTKNEARGWLPPTLDIGHTSAVDHEIIQRMARFHLLDNVRGQAIPFTDEEVARSEITSEVVGIVGSLVIAKLHGTTRGEADGIWRMGKNDWKPRGVFPRSVHTELRGVVVYDTDEERFQSFELAAVGEWKGRSWLNGRRSQSDGKIALWFELAANHPSSRVAPAYVDIYNASWIQTPETASLSDETREECPENETDPKATGEAMGSGS